MRDGLPRSFGEYELREVVGRGAMGIVYAAYQRSLERTVALKVLTPAIAADPSSISRFRREALAAARVQHPSVVAVHEAGEIDGIPFLVMDLVDGTSLDRAFAERRTDREPPEGHRRLALQFAEVADALHAVHQLGIVHRDIKPANLLLDASGRLRVTDFGLASFASSGSASSGSGAVGTPRYMSPEQAAGQGSRVDGRSDLYSLGATLYEALARVPVLEGAGDQLLRALFLTDPVPLRRRDPSVPRDLETIVMRCLEKEPARRYRDAAALASELRRFAAGQEILARPVGRPGRLLRRFVHRRANVAAAILVVGLVGGLAGVAFRSRVLAREIDFAAALEEFDRAILHVPFARRTLARELSLAAYGGDGGGDDVRPRLFETLAPARQEADRALLERLDRAASLGPSDPRVWLRRAQLAFDLDDHRGALAAFEEAARRGATAAETAFGAGACRYQLGDLAGALAGLEEGARAVGADAGETLFARAVVAIDEGRLLEGKELLSRSIRSKFQADRVRFYALLHYGCLLLHPHVRDAPRATDALVKALEIRPHSLEATGFLAISHLLQGNISLALEYGEEAIPGANLDSSLTLNSAYVAAALARKMADEVSHRRFAALWRRKPAPGERENLTLFAKGLVSRAPELLRSSPSGRLFVALCEAAEQGKPALRRTLEALAVDPATDAPTLANVFGLSLERETAGEPEAREPLRQVALRLAALAPDDPWNGYRLACADAAGSPGHREAAAGRLAELAAGAATRVAAACRLERTRVLLELGEKEAARAELEALAAELPWSYAVAGLHARALDALGRLDEAVSEWRREARIRPARIEPLLSASAALARAGRKEQAQELARGALEIAPDHPDALAAAR
jgi:tetratricopeptide (TPR) repeat protein